MTVEVELKPGWLGREINGATEEIKRWPVWKRRGLLPEYAEPIRTPVKKEEEL